MKNRVARAGRLEPTHITILMFSGVILAGTALLMLPFAHKVPISFIDALFTATSAICVTGLMTVNVAETFTTFGQVVIMFLIQLGAIGILTVSSFFMIALGRAVSMKDSSIIHSGFTASQKINIKKLIRMVITFLIGFEAVGIVIFTSLWTGELGFEGALWAALFHSISAFCNAGISIFPNGTVGMEQKPLLDMTFAILIIAGSFGFISITELYERGRKKLPGRTIWSLTTRLVALYTVILIVIGTVGFLAMEYHNTLSGKPVAEQLMSSFFHSVSGRTAGFLNVDFALLENTTLYMFMMLMFIGGSPVSVAGGIKITTLAVIIGMAISRTRGHEKVHIFNRALPEEIVSRSISIVAIAVTIVIAFTTLLLFTESGMAANVQESRGLFIKIAFEVVSAFGTTGSSMGITPDLSIAGKFLVSLLMLIGRLGPITIAMAVTARKSRASYQLSEEPVMVG